MRTNFLSSKYLVSSLKAVAILVWKYIDPAIAGPAGPTLTPLHVFNYVMHMILHRPLVYIHMSYGAIIYCTHCSITLVDCVMLLVMVDWRMSKNMS